MAWVDVLPNAAQAAANAADPLRAHGEAQAYKAAVEHGLDPAVFVPIFTRMIQQESGWNANVGSSSAGARGIAQLMPVHWDYVDPDDPYASLAYAADMAAGLVEYFDGDFMKGVAAYNTGAGNIEQGRYYPETYQYLTAVFGGDMSAPRQQQEEGDDGFGGAFPGGGASGETPVIRQGADGQYYQLANGRWEVIEGMPVEGTGLVNIGDGYLYDPATGKTIDAMPGWRSYGVSQDAIGNRQEQARIGISQGNLDVSRGQLAETRRGNTLEAAQAMINDLLQMAADEDARRQAATDATLAALPYATGEEYFAGLRPTDALVQLGLAAPLRVSPVAFNPRESLLPNEYAQQVPGGIKRLREVAGV